MAITEAEREALRRKYAEERNKRLRADGNEQYVEPTGEFSHYLEDPYVHRLGAQRPLGEEAVQTPGR